MTRYRLHAMRLVHNQPSLSDSSINPANMPIWISCGPNVGHPICPTWGADVQTTWVPQKFGRGFHMEPIWIMPCGVYMGPNGYHVGHNVGHLICPTWSTDGQTTWIPYNFDCGFHMDQYRSCHVVFTWGLNEYHVGLTWVILSASHGAQMSRPHGSPKSLAAVSIWI